MCVLLTLLCCVLGETFLIPFYSVVSVADGGGGGRSERDAKREGTVRARVLEKSTEGEGRRERRG